MRVTANVDKAMIQDVQNRLGEFEKRAPNVISNSLNRAMTTVGSTVRKEVRQEYHIKARDVSETLKRYRAKPSNLRASVLSSGSPIGLDKFKVSPKTINPRRKTPIKIGVKKSSLNRVMGAFMADISGHKVFERTSKSRLPIKRLFGPSVPQMLENEKVTKLASQKGQETFDKRLEQEVKHILQRGSR